jgi:haloalkane dehalogenase
VVNELYPFQGHYLSVGGPRLHYLSLGLGDPVVMLHGNPTWSFFYRRLVSALGDSYHVIAPDHIGCGLSDKPGDEAYDYTLKRRANDLEALLVHLRVKHDITLVLHDWGGMIGMVYATRHPERIKRIVVFNTAAFHKPAAKRMPWQLALCRTPLLGALLVRGLNAFCRRALHDCAVHAVPDAVRQAYLAPYDSWKNRIAVHRFVQDVPLRPGDSCYALVSEVEQRLALLAEVPMLICWGGKDFVFDRSFYVEWLRRFPRAKAHYFEDAGHYLLEDAADEIVPLVREFLG